LNDSSRGRTIEIAIHGDRAVDVEASAPGIGEELTAIHPAGMRMRRFARAEVVALADQWLIEAKGER
jgi:hypothetical protein